MNTNELQKLEEQLEKGLTRVSKAKVCVYLILVEERKREKERQKKESSWTLDHFNFRSLSNFQNIKTSPSTLYIVITHDTSNKMLGPLEYVGRII